MRIKNGTGPSMPGTRDWELTVWTGSSILGCTLRLHQCGPMKICEPLMLSVGVLGTQQMSLGLAYTRPYNQAVNVRNPLVGIKRIDRINQELTNRFVCNKVSSIASLHVWFLTSQSQDLGLLSRSGIDLSTDPVPPLYLASEPRITAPATDSFSFNEGPDQLRQPSLCNVDCKSILMGPGTLIFTLKAAFMDVLCPLLPSNPCARRGIQKLVPGGTLSHTRA
ncbi:hypothetical protein BJY00DRAFT_154933 [Aspergillus carlsbadensis]|nr:hypothetical protein BJY00DRAFT_154933 [Aspergillus carlsbadensis]